MSTMTPEEKTAQRALDEQARKDRARWQRILRVYGITQEEYNELDKGYCPICLREWSEKVRPAVDHDHKDGWVRGVICLYCNRVRVGRFRDADMVQRIADYLRGPFSHTVPKKKPKRKKASKKVKKT